MYRQLDEAAFEWFEPFGRVRENKRKPNEGVLQLVGRETKTGALVRYAAHPRLVKGGPSAAWPSAAEVWR
jgi:hypothetical protein